MGYQFHTITVLVVDSQPAIVELIHDVLRMFGVQRVLTCTDGHSGINVAMAEKPDLLIVDWDLDSIDGLEFTRKIRMESENPYVPIIFMTAFSSTKRVVEARDSGITEFLKKPFTAESMYKRIETVIEKPRKFVRSEKFFGPDRRRHRSETAYTGADRRKNPPRPISPDIIIDFADKKETD